MRKLIIQIPCFNEEETLGTTLSALPRELPGIEIVEWMIINDGSTDRTAEIAQQYAVDHIVNFSQHQGLAKAFMAGIDVCLKAGADVIVNTDADNQYNSEDIPRLIEPVVAGQADIVIGQRPIKDIQSFSGSKKLLQRIGSWVVRIASNTNIPDAPSGFRAISRNAAMRLNVFNDYTYTLEMVIQAGRKNIAITSVPVRTNPHTRPSRLLKSTGSYLFKSIGIITRIFLAYKPLQFFIFLGSFPFAVGFLLGIRWVLLYFLQGPARTHVPSLILAAILLLIGFQLYVFGLVAELLAVNRSLLEDMQLRIRRSEYDPPHLTVR